MKVKDAIRMLERLDPNQEVTVILGNLPSYKDPYEPPPEYSPRPWWKPSEIMCGSGSLKHFRN